MSVAEQHVGKPAISLKDADFNWEDPLDLEGELTEEERMVRDTARGYAQEKLFPRVLKAYREESFDREIMREMGALGLLGATIPEEYGGAGLGYVCLRADRARGRARRLRLSLRDVGAVLAGDASDLFLRLGGAAAALSAQARERRDRRLLRPDRAGLRLRSRLDGDARREGLRRLCAHRRQDVDHQFADRRHRGGVGEARRRRSAASSSSAAPRVSPRRRSRASSRCAPRSPARSCWRTRSCRRRTCCRT